MIIPYKYMNKAVVTFSIAVLALAGCESDSDSSSGVTGGSLSSRILTNTMPIATASHLGASGTVAADNPVIIASNNDNSFRVMNTMTDALGRVTVTIRGETDNIRADGATTDLDDGSDIDDDRGTDDIGGMVTTVGGVTTNNRQTTLMFILNNDLDLDATSTIPSIAPGNAPMWTAFSGDPENLYYRNRARRLTNDGSRVLFKEDVSSTAEVENANYVEYHALAYLDEIPPPTAADPTTDEIVRVEVVLLPNYDDGVAARVVNTEDVNENVLEGENIALGLEFDPGARTVADSNGDSPVSGSVSYQGRYMGQNRLTVTPQSDYDFDGSGSLPAIPSDTPIVVRESNIPVMTMSVNFGLNQDQVSFRIINARLRLNEDIGTASVEGIMDMNIEGRTSLATLTAGQPISLFNGRITRLVAGNLRLTLTEGTTSRSDTISLGTLGVGTASGDALAPSVGNTNSISGYFFDRGTGGSAERAEAVAGNIYWEAEGTLDGNILPGENARIQFGVDHDMTGVFLLERR